MMDILTSTGHTRVDFGDDAFTVGKSRPMIESAPRNGRILPIGAYIYGPMQGAVIGVGIVHPPLDCFIKALKAYSEEVSHV
ncbi:hypothetical protein EVJ20_06760 [Exiguobacterium sp. SH0S1]|uniref:hypothetical protein n=1 Tax=Exiguobacterium sp. SH0S1 TaxID=2510949 RepID=UPI00103D1997|nr:hypothetical protein [Exiguobacterium sp. SH0S1]TCI80993.1 hypothetical protein EVJ20_06760 [Exiguobacterium sp. SH0S1]